jgi:tetratricopeptide (TPR) repeat protein
MEFSVSVLQQKQYPTVVPGPAEAADLQPVDQVSLLLGKGQALLNLGEAEQALSCFDQAVALSPNHADALVKRGMALEKLQRMEAAIESYDRAIAANASMTLAYLYKGAVCNRLQRFREALECYENALKSEQKLAVS